MNEHPAPRPPDPFVEEAASSALVEWRRRGRTAERRLVEPHGAGVWRRHLVPIGGIPAAGAVTGAAIGAGVAAGAFGASLIAAAIAATPLLPLWVLLAGVLLGPSAGALVGWWLGRRRQLRAQVRAAALDDLADSVGAAFGLDGRAMAARPLVQRAGETLRTGRSTVARVAAGRGAGDYRIDPLGDGGLRVTPLERPVDESFVGRFVRALSSPAPAPSGPTAHSDARMAELELRLAHLERAGRIDRAHASYPALVVLQVDRITEYRRLAARAEAIAGLTTPEARELAERLQRDLDECVELMRAGVDELERAVLGDAGRDAEAHLVSLREKYERPAPGAP